MIAKNIIGFTDAGVGDFRDTFSIVITDPILFYATTDELYGAGTGGASFDTKLYLWTESGAPVMANDDSPGGAPFHSLVGGPGAWPGPGPYDFEGTVPTLVAGDKYLLTITGFGDFVDDGTAAPLFDTDRDFSALWGPSLASTGTFGSWGPGDATGQYVIELGGARFCSIIPEPGTAALLALGSIGVLLVRRRR